MRLEMGVVRCPPAPGFDPGSVVRPAPPKRFGEGLRCRVGLRHVARSCELARHQSRPILHSTFYILNFTFLLLALLSTTSAYSQKTDQKKELTRILFVMDASNSMNAFWGNEPKIIAARRVLLESLGPIEEVPNVEIALRLYGHQTRIEPGKQDCDDTKLEVPFGPHSGKAIREKMNAVQCLGTTPIARSLVKAAGDFPDRNSRNIIILITDGIEACDEDPCAVSRALQAKGIILKPFVIGVGLEDATKVQPEVRGQLLRRRHARACSTTC